MSFSATFVTSGVGHSQFQCDAYNIIGSETRPRTLQMREYMKSKRQQIYFHDIIYTMACEFSFKKSYYNLQNFVVYARSTSVINKDQFSYVIRL